MRTKCLSFLLEDLTSTIGIGRRHDLRVVKSEVSRTKGIRAEFSSKGYPDRTPRFQVECQSQKKRVRRRKSCESPKECDVPLGFILRIS